MHNTITWIIIMLIGFTFGWCVAYTIDHLANKAHPMCDETTLFDTTTKEESK